MEFNYSRESREGSIAVDMFDEKAELTVEPLSPDYRTLPITEGFDWPKIIDDIARTRELGSEKLYLVVFRSIRKYEADETLAAELDAFVTQLDDAAHTEAKSSSELLHYFTDKLDEEGRAMSWCLWTERTAARQALSGPAHQLAVRHAPDLYEDSTIEAYDVHLFEDREVVFDLKYKH